MTQSSSNSGAAPAVEKQGGYPELEQGRPATGEQRGAERALGKRMRGQNKDAAGQQTSPPQDNGNHPSVRHGR